MLLPLHVAAGGLAIVLGVVALSVKKGGAIHRRSGLLFVYAMLVMAMSASMLSLLRGKADGNVLASVLTAYFVGTALTTVRPASSWTRRINAGALTVAVVLAFGCALGGVRMIGAPGRDANGVPFQTAGAMSLIVAVLLLMAAGGDVRVMRVGSLRGGPRLARHLWRMCFALFIAAGSFFSLRERVATILPEPLTTGRMRALPIVLLFGTMFYWLWRLRGPRRGAGARPPGPRLDRRGPHHCPRRGGDGGDRIRRGAAGEDRRQLTAPDLHAAVAGASPCRSRSRDSPTSPTSSGDRTAAMPLPSAGTSSCAAATAR